VRRGQAGEEGHAVDEVRVLDNPDELRYELWLGQTQAGCLAYRREPGVVVLIHTDVDPAF
jgi:hypothetical protein